MDQANHSLPTRLARTFEPLIAVQAADEEEARLGRLFVILMAAGMGIMLVLTVLFLLLHPLGLADIHVSWEAALFPLVFIPLSLFCIGRARRGRVRSSIRLYVWTNFLAVSLAALLFDGIVSPAWILYIWTITIAGTFLAPGYALGLTGAAAAYYLLLASLFFAGLYEPPLTFGPQGRTVVGAICLLLMLACSVGLVTYLNMRSLREALRRLREEVAERKRREADARESEKKLRDLTSNLGEGLLVQDSEGQVSFMNPEAERILGWTREEINGCNLHDLIHNKRPDGSPLALEECRMHTVVKTGERYVSRDDVFVRKDMTVFPVSVITAPIRDDGKVVAAVTSFRDITGRKKIEQDRERLIAELQDALKKVRTLSGLLPICASCKRIRDDKGYWNQIESYIRDHSNADFSHGLCPDCAEKMFTELRKMNT